MAYEPRLLRHMNLLLGVGVVFDILTISAWLHAVTIEVENGFKLLPIFVPIPKKDTTATINEALAMCNDRTHQALGSRIARIQADGGGEFSNQTLKDLCFDKNVTFTFSTAHQPSSNGFAERMA